VPAGERVCVENMCMCGACQGCGKDVEGVCVEDVEGVCVEGVCVCVWGMLGML